MKDHRFIELLNLYIDRQITVTETAELEAEIQHNPQRQAVYRQYCRIHTATKLVYDSFRVNATEQPVLPADRAGVVELFETKRRKNHVVIYAGGLAAAACLALVFVRFNPASAPVEPSMVAQTEVAPVKIAPEVVAIPAVPAKAVAAPEVGLVSLRNNTMNPPDYTAMLAALREQDEERAMASGHLQAARVQSLFDDGLFNASRTIPLHEAKPFRIQPVQAQQVDTTVFQFQR